MRRLARQSRLCKKIPPICAECRFERRSNCRLNYRLNCRLNCAARKNSGKSSAAEFSHESCGVSKRTGSAEKRAGLIGLRAPARLRAAPNSNCAFVFCAEFARADSRLFGIFALPCKRRVRILGSAFRRRAQAFCSAFGFFSTPRAPEPFGRRAASGSTSVLWREVLFYLLAFFGLSARGLFGVIVVKLSLFWSPRVGFEIIPAIRNV